MSSPSMRVFLTPEEDRTLFELRKAPDVPQRTKDRAAVLRLNAHGWKVRKIAAHFNWAQVFGTPDHTPSSAPKV